MSMANLLKLRYSLAVSFSPISTSNISKFPALKRVTHISHVWDAACLSFILPQSKKIFFPSHLVEVQRDAFPNYTPDYHPAFCPGPQPKQTLGRKHASRQEGMMCVLFFLPPAFSCWLTICPTCPGEFPAEKTLVSCLSETFTCVYLCVCVFNPICRVPDFKTLSYRSYWIFTYRKDTQSIFRNQVEIKLVLFPFCLESYSFKSVILAWKI